MNDDNMFPCYKLILSHEEIQGYRLLMSHISNVTQEPERYLNGNFAGLTVRVNPTFTLDMRSHPWLDTAYTKLYSWRDTFYLWLAEDFSCPVGAPERVVYRSVTSYAAPAKYYKIESAKPHFSDIQLIKDWMPGESMDITQARVRNLQIESMERPMPPVGFEDDYKVKVTLKYPIDGEPLF